MFLRGGGGLQVLRLELKMVFEGKKTHESQVRKMPGWRWFMLLVAALGALMIGIHANEVLKLVKAFL
jgi:hypothetical protein